MINRFCGFALALTLSAACALSFVPPVQADSAATIKALEQTPVSLSTYGLDALHGGLTSFIGRSGGGQPEPAAMFKAPLGGPIAEIATVISNGKDNTILLNFVKIDPLDQPDGQEACNQAFASIRFDAGIDPATGELQAGVDATLFQRLLQRRGQRGSTAGHRYDSARSSLSTALRRASEWDAFRLHRTPFGHRRGTRPTEVALGARGTAQVGSDGKTLVTLWTEKRIKGGIAGISSEVAFSVVVLVLRR